MTAVVVCHKCNNRLFGAVSFCPYCGETRSGIAPIVDNKTAYSQESTDNKESNATYKDFEKTGISNNLSPTGDVSGGINSTGTVTTGEEYNGGDATEDVVDPTEVARRRTIPYIIGIIFIAIISIVIVFRSKFGEYYNPKGTIVVSLDSTIADVRLSVDGKSNEGEPPWKVDLPVGEHQLEVDGGSRYAKEIRRITVSKAKEQDEQFHLRLLTGKISISSTPSGLSVLVNGARKGTTPVTVELPIGPAIVTHEPVRGYDKSSVPVDVKQDRTVEVTLMPNQMSANGRALASLQVSISGDQWQTISVPGRKGTAFSLVADAPLRAMINQKVYLLGADASIADLPSPENGTFEVKSARPDKSVRVQMYYEK